MSVRERYDDRIRAEHLRAGDELHLTFMGGDDYVTVDRVQRASRGRISWWGERMGDTIPLGEEVWIRKREAP